MNKFHFYLIVLVASLILGLDIGLTSLYKFYKYNKSRKRESVRVNHPVYHHTFKPMISIDDFYGPMKYRLITNSLGFKDKIRRNIKKKISKKRILFIGDSFTEGVGLKYEETFVGLVHSKINKNFDVLNGGRASYCPYLSFLKIKDLVEENNYVINEIFVAIDVTDAQDELFRYFKFKVKNNLMPDTTRYNQNQYRNYLNNSLIVCDNKVKDIPIDSSNPSIDFSIYRLKRILEKKTTIIYPVLNYIYDRYLFGENNKVITNKENKKEDKKSPYQGKYYHVSEIPYYRDAETWSVKPNLYEEWGKLGLDESKKYIDSIKVFCDSRKIKINILIYPFANEIWNIMPSKSYHEKYWIDYADQNNISLFNIYDDFRQRLKGKEKKIFIKENYIVNDVHFNFAGNIKIADYIIKTLDY